MNHPIVIHWQPVPVRYRPRGKQARHPPWDWTFWRATVAGVTFQVGNLPYSLLDFSPQQAYLPPDRQRDSCWQLWCVHDPRDGPERMAFLSSAESENQALETAQRHINAYFADKRVSLQHAIDSIDILAATGQPRLFL